jgi:hypothetical protein
MRLWRAVTAMNIATRATKVSAGSLSSPEDGETGVGSGPIASTTESHAPHAAALVEVRRLMDAVDAAGGEGSDDALKAVAAAARTGSGALRAAVAEHVLRRLTVTSEPLAQHAPWLALAPLVADELAEHCTAESAWQLAQAHDAGAAIAALVVARLPSPVGTIGFGRLHSLATSVHEAQRQVAMAALRKDLRALCRDLARAVELAQEAADDVRAVLLEALRRNVEHPWGVPELLLLLEASHADVRGTGLFLVERLRASGRSMRKDDAPGPAEPATNASLRSPMEPSVQSSMQRGMHPVSLMSTLALALGTTLERDVRHAVVGWAAASADPLTLGRALRAALFEIDVDVASADAAIDALSAPMDADESVVDIVVDALRAASERQCGATSRKALDALRHWDSGEKGARPASLPSRPAEQDQ